MIALLLLLSGCLIQPASAPATRPATRPTVFAWHPTSAEGITAMAWADIRFQAPGVAAASVREQWKDVPQGRRALLVFGLLQRGQVPNDPATFVREGVDIDAERQWCRELYSLLLNRGPTPDRLVIDVEEFGTVFSIFKDTPEDTLTAAPRARVFTRLLADDELRAKLPDDVKAFRPTDFGKMDAVGRRAYTAWNDYSCAVVFKALDELAVEPFRAAFGRDKPVSNYQDVSPAWPLIDPYGGKIRGSTQSQTSSPSLYLYPGPIDGTRAKAAMWNRFLQNLNAARSCLATPDQQVVPWIGLPGYGGENGLSDFWLWEQLVRHLCASGVDTFLLFNPRPPPDQRTLFTRWQTENRAASAVFATLRAGTVRRDLPEIPHDADVVETGDVRTTYEDYLQHYGDGRGFLK